MSHTAEKEITTTSFEWLTDAARKGEWGKVDSQISRFLSSEYVLWALAILVNGDYLLGVSKVESRNIRDFAATILHESDVRLDFTFTHLMNVMKEDPHHLVRYRIAMALWKRGFRTYPLTQVLEEASRDRDIGDLARDMLKAVPA